MKNLSKYLSPWEKTGEIIWSRKSIPVESKKYFKFSIYKQGNVNYRYTTIAGGLVQTLSEAMDLSDSWFRYQNFTLLTEEQYEKYSVLL